ncbi:hypothetical protein QBC46DRAFT_410633 [Diplogelasinospora grovesii]|uniref:Uncharacterized protein n=1 Tax=Diplogelasinospora grovesii TaxID=303347 RepID=A0AAN6N3P4_9PEZI|nr:hypothetical protein QBC46DRAFT_410633 [Diplogelasinospora grovesii]
MSDPTMNDRVNHDANKPMDLPTMDDRGIRGESQAPAPTMRCANNGPNVAASTEPGRSPDENGDTAKSGSPAPPRDASGSDQPSRDDGETSAAKPLAPSSQFDAQASDVITPARQPTNKIENSWEDNYALQKEIDPLYKGRYALIGNTIDLTGSDLKDDRNYTLERNSTLIQSVTSARQKS